MAAMGWPELVCELLRSKLALTLACGRVPTAVSYPNGKCTERTRTAAGWFYAYGVRTFDGTYLTGTDPLLIPRTAIPPRHDTRTVPSCLPSRIAPSQKGAA